MKINFKEFIEKIEESRKLAIKEGIEANAIFINPNMVKVPQLYLTTNNPKSVISTLPLFCGLELHVTDYLPDNYTFAITQISSEREDIEKKARTDTARKIIEEFEQKVKDLKEEYDIDFGGEDYDE